MASNSLLLILLLFTVFLTTLSLHLPITKHAISNQYLTQIPLGSELVTFAIDLSSPSLWLTDCNSGSPVPSLSIPCSTASPSTTTCTVQSTNPFSKLSGWGELHQIEDFLFICAPKFISIGLATGARGVFGLGKASRISPISQFAHQFNLPGKFSLCLPGNSGTGMILAGKSNSEIRKSLLYTPLLETGPGSDDYYIQVKSIMISNKKVSGSGTPIRAKLSTVDPLTKLGSGVYKTFIKAFEMAGHALGLARVESHEPYGLCYSSVKNREEAVPGIDLVLQSEMVRWRINGRNSMVDVGDGVMCLGVLDGRSDLEDEEIVIGAYQLEDVLVEFDLRSGMLGFSSSLIDKGTSCAQISSDPAAIPARSSDL